MKPENRPDFVLRLVRVANLNREDHYRLQLETPTMDQHTVGSWSIAGPVPASVFEDMLACVGKELAHLIPHQLEKY